VLCDAGTPTVLYARDPALATEVGRRHTNERYLPGITLTPSLCSAADYADALDGAELVVFAVPAQGLRATLAACAPMLPRDALLVSLMKGIELGTRKRMSEVIMEVLGVPADRVAVVTGPNLAREIALRQFTACVVACADSGGAKLLQQACHTSYFRPYTNADVLGCELAGAVKNVIALAVGMGIALGLAETARLGAALGADPKTFAGLAGMGDLVATCSSPLSRNRTFGENLGRGMSVAKAAAATSQTVEGVTSCEPLLELARSRGVTMPITEVVAAVIRDELQVADAAVVLASRSAKPEWYGV
jgi:glycerol-3-phosphate dehydrogenase (NAD(P)+)